MSALSKIADGIVTGIGAKLAGGQRCSRCACAPRCSCLVHPLFGIEPAKEKHHERSKLSSLVGGDGAGLRALSRRSPQPLARNTGSHSNDPIRGRRDGNPGNERNRAGSAAPAERSLRSRMSTLAALRKLLEPRKKLASPMAKSFVGTERRKNSRRQIRLRDRLMMSQIIGGIVGGAHNLDVKLLQNWPARSAPPQAEHWRAPRFSGQSLSSSKISNAEVALQLEMRPMVERIAQRVGNGSGPGQKFLVGRSVPGDVVFRDAIGPHGPPFVVVSLQPDFEEIPKPTIFGKCPGEKDDSGSRESAEERRTDDKDGAPHRSRAGNLR